MNIISIVVPVYNVEPYLKECIDSILRQTLKEFVLILVDDGSTDHSGTICDEYKQTDNRIVVIHKSNGGLSDARNAGIDYAFSINAKWITFIDSDDYIHERYLEYLYRAVCDSDCKISIVKYTRNFDEYCNININFNYDLCDVKSFYINDFSLATIAWGKLYELNLFHDVRYPFGKLFEDGFTTYKVLFKCKKIAVLNNCFYFYRRTTNSIMMKYALNFNLKLFDGLESRKEQVDFFKFDIELFDFSKKNYETQKADYILLAYKNHCVTKIPIEYQQSRLKTIFNLYLNCNQNDADYILYKYYPHLVSLKCYAHKLIDMILHKKKGSK